MIPMLDLLLGLGPPPWRAAPEGPVGPNEHPGAFLYAAGSVHDFAFVLPDDSRDALSRNGPDVHATLTYRGVEWDVGFALKGSSTYQDLDGKPSIKIDTEEFVDGRTILGVRRLTLNSMVFDGSMLREHLAYRLYGLAGVPAPRHGYARVRIDDEPYGLYGIVETLDEQWLRRHFPGDSEGYLYDSRFTNADLTTLGVGAFELEEGDAATAYEDLRDLVRALDRDDILDVLDARFDRDRTLDMWAVDLVTVNWDGYSRNTNNYLLYHATVSDTWHFVPWGQDTAFRGGGGVYSGVQGRMVAACLASGACRDALEARIARVLDLWESADLLGHAQATWAEISASCEDDPRRTERCDPESLFETLAERPSSVRRELGL